MEMFASPVRTSQMFRTHQTGEDVYLLLDL